MANDGGIFSSVARDAASGPLTEDCLRAAMDKIRDAPYAPHPCKLGRHLVSPTAKRCGYGVCVECGSPVGAWPENDEAPAG